MFHDTPRPSSPYGGVATRRYYTLFTHLKTYSAEQRIDRLKRCFSQLRVSYGRSIFNWKHWRLLIKSLWGSIAKQSKILDHWVKIETLGPLNQRILETPNLNQVNFYTQMNERGIALNCLNPPKVDQINQKRPEVIEAYLAEAVEKGWWKPHTAEWVSLMRKLFDAIDVLTFDELQIGLYHCCQKLQALLGNNAYAVGFANGKSTKWIAELAIPYLSYAPTTSFSHASDNMSAGTVRSYQSALDPHIHNYVIFDDAAYSGQQLGEIIKAFRGAISRLPDYQQYYLYIVVPFMSCHAVDILRMNSESDFALPGKVNVKIITTQRRVKAMTDVLSTEEFDRIFAIEGTRALSAYCNQRTRNKCLSFMEWKVPDHASMPKDFTTWEEVNPEGRGLVDKDRFITNHPPPYKTDRPRR